jgi:predicted 3-demethylubiquinone-9 3-methyltransferase (glyoxalase superfamily)
MVVVFTLAGQSFLSLNQGGPNFAFNESTSLLVDCEEGWEVDHSWNGLVENGGKET